MCLVLPNFPLKVGVHEELGRVLWMGTSCCHKFCVLLMDNILQAIEEVGKEGEWEYRLTPLLFVFVQNRCWKSSHLHLREEGGRRPTSDVAPFCSTFLQTSSFCIFTIAAPFWDLTLYQRVASSPSSTGGAAPGELQCRPSPAARTGLCRAEQTIN